MKKLIPLFVLLIFVIPSANSVAEGDYVRSIPVEFTADRVCNIGFSSSIVSGTIYPSDADGVLLTSKEFTVSDDFSSYTTGPFYLICQFFTTYPLEVVIKANQPGLSYTDSNGQIHTIQYSNSGINTSNSFAGSGNLEDSVIFREADSSYAVPRAYNTYQLNLNIPVEDNIPAGNYSGNLTVTVRTQT